jgi:hypothetical protein
VEFRDLKLLEEKKNKPADIIVAVFGVFEMNNQQENNKKIKIACRIISI